VEKRSLFVLVGGDDLAGMVSGGGRAQSKRKTYLMRGESCEGACDETICGSVGVPDDGSCAGLRCGAEPGSGPGD